MLGAPPPVPEASGIGWTRFQEEIRPAGQPVVMRGLASDWPGVAAACAGDRAIVDYLLGFATPHAVGGIMIRPELRGRFFYDEAMAGFNFSRHEGQLGVFLHELLRIAEEPEPPGMAVQSEPVARILPGFVEANPMPLVPGVAPRIWLGNRIRVAPHFDLMENIAVCLAGRRTFTVFPPEQLPNLYPGPFERTPAGTPVSMVDPQAPDLEAYPRYEEAWAHAMQVTLEPGDALYLPYAWWHGVDALEPVSILVNYWWNDAPQGIGGGYDALLHAILAWRHLPESQRAVWRMIADHYVFDANGDPGAHLPDHAKGIMGPGTPQQLYAMRQMLKQVLGNAP